MHKCIAVSLITLPIFSTQFEMLLLLKAGISKPGLKIFFLRLCHVQLAIKKLKVQQMKKS